MSYTQDIKTKTILSAAHRRTINVRGVTKQEFDGLKGDRADWLFFEEIWTVYKQQREKADGAIAS